MKNIPIIIPVFNQLTYLKNLMLWWRWYHPKNEIIIIDNGSTYDPLLEFYEELTDATLIRCHENNFIKNLNEYLNILKYDFYVISDPDIMPHPNTPMNFLEIWKNHIESHKFHRAGFNLITSDLPKNLNEREMIIHNESELLKNPVVKYGNFIGYKAPIDTTFCLYSRANGGWEAPMRAENWGNCLRLFNAFHYGWYVDGDNLNDELKFYFENSKYRVPGEPSAGKNNNRPKQFQ